MPSFMHTRTALAPNARSNSLDVITVKSGLSALGTYAAPEWGVTPYPDRALFDAIRAFQKSNGLTVDGVIKPDGETLAALQAQLRGAKNRTAVQTAAHALQDLGRNGDMVLAHLTQSEAQLLHDITDGGSINPKTGLLEFWSFSDFIGGSSDSDTDDATDTDQNDDGPSFFDNFAEDFGNLLSGNSTSPHSAYDVRNADAMVERYGGEQKDYLPGGDFGPGGGSYSSKTLHEAGRHEAKKAAAQKTRATVPKRATVPWRRAPPVWKKKPNCAKTTCLQRRLCIRAHPSPIQAPLPHPPFPGASHSRLPWWFRRAFRWRPR